LKQYSKHLFPYEWYLKNGYPSKGIEKHNKKVFGTFVCGGGSTMGYKLAGFEHLGGVEIDPKVAQVYKENHAPKHFYIEDLRLFNKRNDLPKELYNIDLLDGSPPCSSFSMAGSREKGWGKDKKFREGQTKQVLDDLVYIYIDTIEKLRPKVALLENVKGLIQGNAKSYAKKIKSKFEKLGYRVQVFLLNAASMGVPQKRERVFFIGLRNDFNLPKLVLSFNEKAILFGEIKSIYGKNKPLGSRLKPNFDFCIKTKSKDFAKYNEVVEKKRANFNWRLCFNNKTPDTITSGAKLIKENSTYMNESELSQIGSYPLDYNFKNVLAEYLIGMSVPPVMTAQISNQIYKQWLSKL